MLTGFMFFSMVPGHPRSTRHRRSWAPAFAVALMVGVGAAAGFVDNLAWADSHRHERDHDRAREARRRGEVRPLGELSAVAERLLGARVIEVELDDDDGVPVYEFDLLRPDGQVLKLEVDARDGRWLELKGRSLEKLFPVVPASAGSSPR